MTFSERWFVFNMPADPTGGTRSECYESESTLVLVDEVYYVLEETSTFLIGDSRVDADKGTLSRIPAKTIHDSRNMTGNRTGVRIFFNPGWFVRNIPSIVKRFEGNGGRWMV